MPMTTDPGSPEQRQACLDGQIAYLGRSRLKTFCLQSTHGPGLPLPPQAAPSVDSRTGPGLCARGCCISLLYGTRPMLVTIRPKSGQPATNRTVSLGTDLSCTANPPHGGTGG
jgi:hypothetical protein